VCVAATPRAGAGPCPISPSVRSRKLTLSREILVAAVCSRGKWYLQEGASLGFPAAGRMLALESCVTSSYSTAQAAALC